MSTFMGEFYEFFENRSLNRGVKKMTRDTTKCGAQKSKGDFSLFLPRPTEPLLLSVEELVRSFESAHPSFRDTLRVDVSHDRIYLSLNRPFFFQVGLLEVVERTCLKNQKLMGKEFSLSIENSGGIDSLTHHRCNLVAETLINILRSAGAVVTEGDENGKIGLNLTVTTRSNRHLENGICIFVGHVLCNKSNNPVGKEMSFDDCNSALLEEISLMSEHRLGGNQDLSRSDLDILVGASIKMALLGVNIKNNVSFIADSTVTTYCKRAIFVLYNYCRMAHLIHKYQRQVDVGYYPPLPAFNSVDFSLLTRPDEWNLMLNYIIHWPEILNSITSNVESGVFKVPLIVTFLNSFSNAFSAYYRCTRILTESRPNLLPVMHARIHLLLGLIEVFKMALRSLGIQPLSTL